MIRITLVNQEAPTIHQQLGVNDERIRIIHNGISDLMEDPQLRLATAIIRVGDLCDTQEEFACGMMYLSMTLVELKKIIDQ